MSMVSVVSLLIVFAGLVVCLSCDKFCASIDSISTNGAFGFVALSIGKGRAVYDLSLDLTHFTTTCDLTQGLKYHVHSYWNNATSDSSANGLCGAASTGGHYDPNFACSTSSQSISSDCVSLSRVSPDYVYNCTEAAYHAGRYSYCELGDISGKNGILYPNSGSLVFQLSCPFVDFFPLYAANYNFSDTNSLPWTSIVFHCAATNTRLVCAKFSKTDLDACSSSFSKYDECTTHHSSSNNGIQVSEGRFTVAVALSVVFCLIGGICLGILVCRYKRSVFKPPTYEVLDFEA